MRRAKIVCTIGPVTESREQIQALVDAGMDVARINRSHGDQEAHELVYRNVRAAAQASGRAVAVLVDLQGPKIRLGTFVEGKVELTEGDTFTITTDDVPGTKERASTTYKGLPGDAKVGDQILIDDGRVGVRIVAVEGNDVVTTVELAGPISNNKGLNLPGVAVSVLAMSCKDEEDLRWALRLGADIIALSFVRSAKDYDDVARIMAQEGRVVPVIAKIEKPQAVDNLAEIIDATQVLESMISAPRPTRAEASDCANAILDGADAVMLSGETSVGDYPIEAVRTMARIIENTEELGRERMAPLGTTPYTRGGAITRAAAEIGEILGVKYLITFTQSGDSARRMSRLRSPIPLIAFTPLTKVRSELALSWGVQTYELAQVEHSDAMVRQVDWMLRDENLVADGDLVVIVSGAPVGVSGTTNSILVHKIGQLSGTGTVRAAR